MDAGQRPGRPGVDTLDTRMGMFGADKRGVQHVRQNDIVDIAAVAGDQSRVFRAEDLSAKVTHTHGYAPFRMAAPACSPAATMP